MQREKSLTYKGKRHLPLPSGPYSVGCCDIMTSYLKCGIFVRLYYPSKEQGILMLIKRAEGHLKYVLMQNHPRIVNNDLKNICCLLAEERHLQWPQWTPHKQYINGYARTIGIPPCIFRKVFRIYVGNLYIPAIWEAGLKPTEGKYPVIIFSHGLSGWRCTYSAICLELASRGYVVAALEHRDHSASASFFKREVKMSTSGSKPAPDLSDLDLFQDLSPIFEDSVDSNSTRRYQELGPFFQTKEWVLYQNPPKENKLRLRVQQLKFRVRECSEAVDLMENLNVGRQITNVLNVNFDTGMFENKLDLSRCCFIGHSFGGATGISSLTTELRFKCGIFLDPWMFPLIDDKSCFSKIAQPFLCVIIKSFQNKKSMADLKKLQCENTDSDFLVLKNAQHRDVSDDPFVRKFSFSLASKLGHRIERFSALDLTVDLILRYLGKQLGGCWQTGSSELEMLKQRYLSEEDFSSLETE